MTDKVQLIKEEIEYRLSSGKYSINSKQALEDVIDFIDSLPEEHASEDLEEEIKGYIKKEFPDGIGFPNVPKIARYFAEWQKQEMMKDAVEGTVKYEIGSAEIPQCDRRYQVLSDQVHIPNAKLGDKVKIIIVKEK